MYCTFLLMVGVRVMNEIGLTAKWSKLLKFLEDFKTINRYDCDCVVNYVVTTILMI